jgi:hypothetical protein
MFEHRAAWQKQQFQVTSTATIANTDTASDAITIKNNTTKGLSGETTNVADDSYLGLECEVWSASTSSATNFGAPYGTYKGVVRIYSKESDTTIKVKNLTGTAITLANDDYFVVISNARGENTEAPEAWADELKTVYNSTQFFSTAVEISEHLAQASLRGYSDELDRLRRDKAKEFMIQKAKAYLLGASKIGTGMSGTAFADSYTTDANGKAVRTTFGLVPAIRTYGVSTETADNRNIWNFNANDITFKQVMEMVEKAFQYGDYGGMLPMVCGRGMVSFWTELATRDGDFKQNIQMYPLQSNELGYRVAKLVTPHGEIMLAPTDAMKYQYANSGVIVSIEDLYEATYLPEEFKNNIKTDNDYSGVKDVYRADSGIGITLIEKHHFINVVR